MCGWIIRSICQMNNNDLTNHNFFVKKLSDPLQFLSKTIQMTHARSSAKSPPDRHASILGTRVRQRRREIGLGQAELAKRVGISPSYLNLIEWNKRRIAGRLLGKIAEALDLSVDELQGVGERRLLEALDEIAGLGAYAHLGIEGERSAELIGRFPGWARAIATVARAEREATARASALSDRLSNDPFLGEAIHRMLTRISAVRSASEIVSDYHDIEPERRDRFLEIVRDESRALSGAGEALAAYLDKAEDADRILTPTDEVETFFETNDNNFSAIEVAAEALARELTDPRPISRRKKAQGLVETRLGSVIDQIVQSSVDLATEPARLRASRALMDYAVGAVLMPLSQFSRGAAELGYDIEALAEMFSVEIEVVCHRLTALPGETGSPTFAYFRSNAAGTIIEMLGLPGLALPRYASACPLWALFRAQQSPEAVIRQRALFPSGKRFVFVVRARHTGPTGFGKPRHYLTDMIAMTEEDAGMTVYAPDSAVAVEEVGPSCRLCPRHACIHRVEDPLAG